MKNNNVLIAGIIIAALFFVGLFAWQGGIGRSTTENKPNLIGNPDAPVQVIEYADFGCPACDRLHASGTMEQLSAQFGDEISIEYRHFPVITTDSPKAAEASECAAEQDAFWVYHDYLFEEAAQGLKIAALKEYATAVNLNRTDFDQCLDSGKYKDTVDMDEQSALDAGARGTPTILVNGNRVIATYEDISRAIHDELGN